MVSWLERQGYDVAYVADTRPRRATGARVQGHTAVHPRRRTTSTTRRRCATRSTAARDAGTSASSSAARNSVYWQIRFEASPISGARDRVARSPTRPSSRGRPTRSGIPTEHLARPERRQPARERLVGIMYVGDSDFTFFPLRVSAAEGQDPRLAPHRPGGPRARHLPERRHRPRGLGVGCAASTTAASRPACATLASSPVTGNLFQGNGASVYPGLDRGQRDQVHGASAAPSSSPPAPTTGTAAWTATARATASPT